MIANIISDNYIITNEQIMDLPLWSYDGDVFIVDDFKGLKEVMPLLKDELIFGFDTETKPVFKKGHYHNPALLQLATANAVVLIRLNKIGLPEVIRNILSDRNIVKIGVAPGQDIAQLQKMSYFRPYNVIDLNSLCINKGFVSQGVKKLTALVLGIRLSKKQQVSNWEAAVLTNAQVVYAATDAWVCREIYLKLLSSF